MDTQKAIQETMRAISNPSGVAEFEVTGDTVRILSNFAHQSQLDSNIAYYENWLSKKTGRKITVFGQLETEDDGTTND